MTNSLTRISVRVTDQQGGLEILHGDQLVLGAILNATAGVSPGQPMRLRMQMNEGDTELVEVLGQAVVNDDVALMTGLEFDIDLTRMTRAVAPPALPEGFSELPTLHMPQAAEALADDVDGDDTAAELPLESAPVAAADDAPRAVTIPTDTAVDLGPDPDVFEDELSEDTHSAVFADADDDIFQSQGDAEPSRPDEDPIELTRLEQEIAALDASIDPTMTQPAPPPPVDDDEVRVESELRSLEAVLERAASSAVGDAPSDDTHDRPAKPRSGFEEDERQTTRELMAGRVQLESVSNEEEVGEPAPYEQPLEAQPGYGFDPNVELEEEPTLDEPTGIVGNLREMSLCELVQSMEIARKTAQVVVSPSDDESGSVFVENGRVRWAEQGELEGEEAFFRLGRALRGTFRMRFGVRPPGENVSQPTPYLVLEALCRMDEGRASGELAIPVLEKPRVKERLPSAREVVRKAQRAHARHERRRTKTQPPARPKSTPPQPAAAPPPLPPEALEVDEHSLDVREVHDVAAAVVSEASDRREKPEQTEPRKSGGGLFASFFDEASQADNVLDDDDTALARVLSSSDEGRPAKPAR